MIKIRAHCLRPTFVVLISISELLAFSRVSRGVLHNNGNYAHLCPSCSWGLFLFVQTKYKSHCISLQSIVAGDVNPNCGTIVAERSLAIEWVGRRRLKPDHTVACVPGWLWNAGHSVTPFPCERVYDLMGRRGQDFITFSRSLSPGSADICHVQPRSLGWLRGPGAAVAPVLTLQSRPAPGPWPSQDVPALAWTPQLEEFHPLQGSPQPPGELAFRSRHRK